VLQTATGGRCRAPLIPHRYPQHAELKRTAVAGRRHSAHHGAWAALSYRGKEQIMHVAYTLGRILLPVVFIVAGIRKFLYVSAFAKDIEITGFPLPDDIAPYLGGVPKFEALGYLIAAVEVICGLMVMIGMKARWGAVVLIVFAACTVFFVNHFWDMDAAAFSSNLRAALMNLSIIGGLLLVAASGSGSRQMDRRPL
jgi:putative oxidoreductase